MNTDEPICRICLKVVVVKKRIQPYDEHARAPQATITPSCFPNYKIKVSPKVPRSRQATLTAAFEKKDSIKVYFFVIVFSYYHGFYLSAVFD